MDTFLKIWAIVGPLLVAAISALWLRRTQLQDREHEVEQRRLGRNEALEDEERSLFRSLSEADRKELRLVASDFIYCTGEFVDAHLDLCLSELPANTFERCARTKEKFNKVSHQLILMAPDELSQATIRLQNCAAEFLLVHKNQADGRFQSLTEEYTAAKAGFLSSAKKLLEVRLIEA